MRTISRPVAVAAAVLSVGAGLLVTTPGAGSSPAAASAAAEREYPECRTQIPRTPNTGTGEPATSAALHVGDLAAVYDPGPNDKPGGMPALFGFDTGTAAAPTRTVNATFHQNLDSAELPLDQYYMGQSVSGDGGQTFSATATTQGEVAGGMTTVRLRNGDLFSIAFKPVPKPTSTQTAVVFPTWRRANGSTSWTPGTMTWHAPAGKQVYQSADRQWPTIRTSGAPLELADGTIVVPLYLKYVVPPAEAEPGQNRDGGATAELAQSTDGGLNFSRRGVIGGVDKNDPYYGPDPTPVAGEDPWAWSAGGNNEAFVSRRVDGSLIAVVRRDYNVDSKVRNLRQTISTDEGLTWSPLVDAPISYDGAAAAGHPGINPQLSLMPNGILMLSSGRANDNLGTDWVAMSANGMGTDWVGTPTFRNCEVTTSSNNRGSGGNTGLTWSDATSVVQAVDACHPSRSATNPQCVDTDYTETNEFRIYRRIVHGLTPNVGKIDLAGKIRAGTVTVSGNMTHTSPDHPRTGVAGAFDGSTEYWSSAVAAGGPGTMTVALDKTYQISRIGWSLRTGLPESARVSVSTDGTTWTQVVDGPDRTHYSVRYITKSPTVAAKYVKIDIDATTSCESGLGSSCAFLNELELYSTTDSFENDAELSRPRGWTGLTACWVSRAITHDSGQTLVCNDERDDAMAAGRYLGTTAATKTIDFKVRPITVASSVLFSVRGKNGSTDVSAFHFAITPSGALKRHNGTAWAEIAPAGTFTIGDWNAVTIEATATAATVKVGGTTVASGVPNYQAATSLQGLNLSSGGTVPTGDYFAVDDVVVP